MFDFTRAALCVATKAPFSVESSTLHELRGECCARFRMMAHNAGRSVLNCSDTNKIRRFCKAGLKARLTVLWVC